MYFQDNRCVNAITPDNTYEWYRINSNDITDNHKIALCNDTTVHMVLLPPAEPLEINAFKTIARLPFLQMQHKCFNNTHTQPMHSN